MASVKEGRRWDVSQAIELCKGDGDHPDLYHPPDCEWRFGDAPTGAGLNPLRWSGSKTLSGAAEELGAAKKKGDRPIVLKVPSGVLSREEPFNTIDGALEHLKKKGKLPKGTEVAGRDERNWHTVAALSDAVKELQTGKLKADAGFCLVFAQSQKKFFMLYRSDKEKEAYKSTLKIAPPMKLVEWKAMQIVESLPKPARSKLEELSHSIGAPVWKTVIGAPGIGLVMSLGLCIYPSAVLNLVGCAYPLLETQKVIEAPTPATPAIEFWLSYWMIFALLKCGPLDMKLPVGSFLAYPLKISFLVWLYLPRTRGASLIMQHVQKYALPKMRGLQKKLA